MNTPLVQLDKALSSVMVATHKGLEISQFRALVLLAKAGDGGMTITDLADAIDYQHGSASRLVYQLSALPPKGRKGGYGLIDITVDLARPRFKIVKLTTKGKQLLKKVFKTLGMGA